MFTVVPGMQDLLTGKLSSFSVGAICYMPHRENVIYFTK